MGKDLPGPPGKQEMNLQHVQVSKRQEHVTKDQIKMRPTQTTPHEKWV